MIFADVHLARRLEGAEAQSNIDFVEARAHVNPDVGAAWIYDVRDTRKCFAAQCRAARLPDCVYEREVDAAQAD